MCTGKDDFEGALLSTISKLKEIEKIEIPDVYSSWLLGLIKDLISFDPKDRPTVRKILNREEIKKHMNLL